MCGFIFKFGEDILVEDSLLTKELSNISWRGPDVTKFNFLNNGTTFLGHCRLTILDLSKNSDQPMVSSSGRYHILFNGEIYNHNDIRRNLNLDCKTTSDTETILEAYELIGNAIFEQLDGMFAIVIYDSQEHSWVAARDAFGIKPMYISKYKDSVLIASEPAPIANLVGAKYSKESLEEWKIIRRPLPGKSYFEGVDEIKPGSFIDSRGCERKHWNWIPTAGEFEQAEFEKLLIESVSRHELSDVDNVSLLSGGLDSALITSISNLNKCYSVGLRNNNEFEGAQETAGELNRDLVKVSLESEELKDTWKFLTKLRGEPLSVPNEGLIYKVCSEMGANEKVVLTGEGADELLFGYDGIFRWAINQRAIDAETFLLKYGYSSEVRSERLISYVAELAKNKTPIEFVEDFFYQVHLPGLLRRMDFASMAASKEARVPFVTKSLISYLYRQPWDIKINETYSKIPIRILASKFGLKGALSRKKIGFSAKLATEQSRVESYSEFQSIVLEELGW